MEPQSNLTTMNINPHHFQDQNDQSNPFTDITWTSGPITASVLQLNEETGELRWVQL